MSKTMADHARAYRQRKAAKLERLAVLEVSVRDLLASMEYWAGCDEGCSLDDAYTEITKSGGLYPASAYDAARKALGDVG